jgi:RNA polymerase sigma-54 factor
VESDSETSIREVLNLLEAPEIYLYKWNHINDEYEEIEDQDDSLNGEEVEELEQPNGEDEFDFEDYLTDDDEIPNYKLNANNTSSDDERREVPFVSGTTFQEMLISQLGLRDLTENQYQIALHIIGNLDDSGYLNRDIMSMVDDLAFTQNMVTTKDDILFVLAQIQEFDPPGVGARNLQECLLIQLKRNEDQTPAVELAIHLIDRYFNEFTKKHYDKILKKARITEDELKDAIEEILKLNPKPGNSLSETTKTNHYILPDFIIYNNNGEL